MRRLEWNEQGGRVGERRAEDCLGGGWGWRDQRSSAICGLERSERMGWLNEVRGRRCPPAIPHPHLFSFILSTQGSIGLPGPLGPLGEKGKRVSCDWRGQGETGLPGGGAFAAVHDGGPLSTCVCAWKDISPMCNAGPMQVTLPGITAHVHVCMYVSCAN